MEVKATSTVLMIATITTTKKTDFSPFGLMISFCKKDEGQRREQQRREVLASFTSPIGESLASFHLMNLLSVAAAAVD